MQEEINKLNEKIGELQCNVNDLQEKLDNQEEDVNTFPKGGETYYYISSTGTIIEDYYEGSMFDIKVTEFGNCFRTKEEAKKAVEKLKALKRLRDGGLNFQRWNGFVDGGDHFECCGVINVRAGLNNGGTEQDKKDLDLLFGGEK